MKIEFAILYENRTWDTEVVDVPFDEDTQLSEVQDWAAGQLLDGSRFSEHAVLVIIYNDSPEE